MNNLASLQLSDPILSKIRETVSDAGHSDAVSEKYMLHNNLSYKKTRQERKMWKVCVPTCMEDDLIKTYHLHLGHAGSKRVALALEQNFYIKRIGNYVGKCLALANYALKPNPSTADTMWSPRQC